ncbi:hypothetical protein [Streptantibioticus cattleyicolor]|uniref:Uncharacterized protein n=1 Tax=Streptantibioticus cattleyicolor (strain ATCC 35852 / DSM 46488 / JCM 4925 / NBRC 14057 / NRRL 8057) TaxID=1003195 RepID=F8JKL6_STREN|nr:hypothetical protein [Streptantibioticus cattleyicolor]AEW99709.1 hypothetical protein SCATT_p15160 [Streptantibioticus cattleyicolor NRRL 8057 = DSM 46488]CCB71252.1 protein of unknown function [Streptantibioticus cattleyicolor NRRL 8057 = DSM 46488]
MGPRVRQVTGAFGGPGRALVALAGIEDALGDQLEELRQCAALSVSTDRTEATWHVRAP